MNDGRHQRPRDRTARLVSFGVLAVLVGVVAISLSLLQVAQVLFAPSRTVAGVETDPRSALAGAVVYVGLGASFLAAGSGSIRRRRWAPPILRVLSWAWLVGGLLTLPLLPRVVEQALEATVGDPALVTPEVVRFTQAVVMGLAVVFGVLLPAVFAWAYHDRDVAWTCRAHQATASWTDGCPSSVLGLGLGFGAFAVMALVAALRPVFPLFGALARGWPAAGLLILTALASAWLARATYRRRRIAWRAALVLLTFLGVSSAVSLHRVPLEEWYAGLGYPPGLLPVDSGFRALLVWSTMGLTIVTVFYMLAVRRHFDS